MNRTKLTVIAHIDLEFCNPVSSEKVDRMIGLLDLPVGSRVFDAGCGKAEMLIRIVERYGAIGVGVDTNREFLNVARARAAGRVRLHDPRDEAARLGVEPPHGEHEEDDQEDSSSGSWNLRALREGGDRSFRGHDDLDGRRDRERQKDQREECSTTRTRTWTKDGMPPEREPSDERERRHEREAGDQRENPHDRDGTLELHEIEAAQFLTGHALFDAALCVGSTHAFGDYRHTLRALSGAVRPGGLLLIGEGFWKRDPHPDYLAAVGANRAEFIDHEGNVALAVKAGLVPLYASVSSEDEWDHYEGLYLRAVERYVTGNPDDPDGERMRTHIRKWRDAYLRWGRQTLGFAMYLFRK